MDGHCAATAGVGKSTGCFAWLKNYRRICSRWERHAANFLGVVQLGCTLILLRHLWDYY
jgi:transposase